MSKAEWRHVAQHLRDALDNLKIGTGDYNLMVVAWEIAREHGELPTLKHRPYLHRKMRAS